MCVCVNVLVESTCYVQTCAVFLMSVHCMGRYGLAVHKYVNEDGIVECVYFGLMYLEWWHACSLSQRACGTVSFMLTKP